MELLKIETQRLLLRQFAIGDAEDVFAILSDEQTTLDCGGYHAFEEMDEEYERLMQKFAAQTRYSIVCRETGRVIGMMSMMDAERAVPGWEFGIEIAPDARRRGYAREALQAVVQTYFEKTNAEMFTGGRRAQSHAPCNARCDRPRLLLHRKRLIPCCGWIERRNLQKIHSITG